MAHPTNLPSLSPCSGHVQASNLKKLKKALLEFYETELSISASRLSLPDEKEGLSLPRRPPSLAHLWPASHRLSWLK